jgi:GPH family glycoside/pentoside/hexuronide:cation symporter
MSDADPEPAAVVRGMRTIATYKAYAAYGLLGMPLAMSALPVYVQAPAYYVSQLGLALASTGWVLFLARLVDTLQDPFMGQWIDRLRGGLHGLLIFAACLLALAFLGLWLPPVAGAYLAPWLALMLMLAYTAHSMLNISYLSWGARLQRAGNEQDGILLGAAAWREGAGLAGVIVASVVPSMILAGDHKRVAVSMGWYSASFAMVLMVAMFALLRLAPPWQRNLTSSLAIDAGWRDRLHDGWHRLAENRKFRQLLAPYFLNALSVSIPATLVLFFINDRLQEPTRAGAFLATYFIAAAIGLPIWVALAKRIGVVHSWRLGMVLAIAAFSGAATLTAGDAEKYFAVCIAAGLALGSDLALPPVLLAQVIAADDMPASYYGVWTLLGKLALALSGLILPLLSYCGYHPGQPGAASLAWAYAGVPCGFKLVALLFLTCLNQRELT